MSPRPRYPEDADAMRELLESDWPAFARAVAHTPDWGLSGCMVTLMPEIRARPELMKLLKETLPRIARPVVVEYFEKWLPRTIIVEDDRSVGQIAMALALEHDPDFPALNFDSPRAKCSTRPRREGSETTQELIQDGRGWRTYGTVYEWGPGEIGETWEMIATAIHPEWTLTVTRNETTGSKTELWSSFEPWEKVPDADVEIVGMAEITKGVGGSGLAAQLIVGIMAPEHGVRLRRDGNLRWQGSFEKLIPSKGEELPLEEGRGFKALLDVSFELQAGDILECFTK